MELSSGPSGREFSGTCTRLLLEHVHECGGPAAVQATLDLAGDPRPAADLLNDTIWSSYAEFRRLLEAASTTIGVGHTLGGFASTGRLVADEAEQVSVCQELGSVTALLENLAVTAGMLWSVIETEAGPVGESEWFVSYRLRAHEHFPELCQFQSGLVGLIPRLFGYSDVEVSEQECAGDGAPACRFRLQWEEPEAAVHRADFLEVRLRAVESRLEGVHRTVADLVSGESLDHVLARIVTSVTRAVVAPSYVLAIEPGLPTTRRVHSSGLDPDAAQALATELLATKGAPSPGRLIAEVASSRRSYGRLAAIRYETDGFTPHEQDGLADYARLAAAALDSAVSVEESRRQAAMARSLLDLSQALAELTSVDEIAHLICRTVTSTIGCDRSVLVLRDRAEQRGRIVASYGYPAEVESRLRTARLDLSLDSTVAAGQVPRSWTLLDAADGLAVPVTTNGEVIGTLVAADSTHAQVREDPGTGELLRGLAAQAATAVRNTRLVDHIRHQAAHDGLTGLANRTRVFEQAEQVIARCRRAGSAPAALYVDLDGFKFVNDTLGHQAGDDLLRMVAGRMTSCLRPTDTVGRLGGDEFIVVLDNAEEAAVHVASRILDALRAPFKLPGHDDVEVTVTASIGIATGLYQNPAPLFRDADQALYHAKAQGKDRHVTHRSAPTAAAPAR